LAIQHSLATEFPTRPELRQDLARSRYNFGNLLRAEGRLEDAEASYRAALAIYEPLAVDFPTRHKFRQDLADCYNALGKLHHDAGRLADAEVVFSAALAARKQLAADFPESPDHVSELGITFNELALLDFHSKRFDAARDKLQEAIEWQTKALSLNPSHAAFRQAMADHYRNLLMTARGLDDSTLAAEAQRGLDAVAASDPRAKVLDARLAAVIQRKMPRDNAERLTLAQRAYDTQRYALAARLWGDALESDPSLVEFRQNQHRYNAACAAALAGCGKGADDSAPTDEEKSKLRQQALEWLRAELDLWTKLLESANDEQRAAIVQTLNHWRNVDADLLGIRDENELAKLPKSERDAFRKLWADVDALLTKAQGAIGTPKKASGSFPSDPFSR
jgi:tetratricopeptide (TPR) repeat protein